LGGHRSWLDPTDPKPYAIEYGVQRGDGEGRCVEAHGLTYFEGVSHERCALSMVGTAQDVTERKAPEEREHLLEREVNHRAKNMLSVVEAIAHQIAVRTPEISTSAGIVINCATRSIRHDGKSVRDIVRESGCH
jgi:hypothetical protein